MLIHMAPSSPPVKRTLHLLKTPDILLANDTSLARSYLLVNGSRETGSRSVSRFALNRRSSYPASGTHTPGFRKSQRQFLFCNTLARGKRGRHRMFPQTAGGGCTQLPGPVPRGTIQSAQQLVGSFSRAQGRLATTTVLSLKEPTQSCNQVSLCQVSQCTRLLYATENTTPPSTEPTTLRILWYKATREYAGVRDHMRRKKS